MSWPLRLGVMPSPQGSNWEALKEVAQYLDGGGIDCIWVSDHLTAPAPWPRGGTLDAVGLLGGLAAVTRSAYLGGMVHPVSLRQPAMLLKTLTTIDHISGGRLYMGLGAGWFEAEHIEAGVEFKVPRERLSDLADAVRLFRAGFGDESVRPDIRAPFRAFENRPQPLSPPRILIGGSSEATLRVVARWANAWNVIGAYGDVQRRVERLRALCEAEGRLPDEIELSLHVGPLFLRDSDERALSLANRIYAQNGLTHSPRAVALKETPEDRPSAIGTARSVAANLKRYQALGFSNFYFDLFAPYDYESIDILLTELRAQLSLSHEQANRCR